MGAGLVGFEGEIFRILEALGGVGYGNGGGGFGFQLGVKGELGWVWAVGLLLDICLGFY